MRQPTLADLVLVYVRERRAAGTLADATAPNVKGVLLGFCRAVDVAPGALRAEHVERWMGCQRVARGTTRTRFSMVRVFCRWLILRGHLAADPTQHLRAPRQPRPVPRAVDAARVGDLIGTLPDSRAHFIVVWMVQLGLRAVELARLEYGDIDVEARSVIIHGKGGWQRLLPITEQAWEALLRYRATRPEQNGPVLRNIRKPSQALSPNCVSRLVSGWMRDAGLSHTGHALRHSTATHLFRDHRVDLRDVQQVLGHQALSSTAVYLPHSDLQRLRTVMEGRWYGRAAS